VYVVKSVMEDIVKDVWDVAHFSNLARINSLSNNIRTDGIGVSDAVEHNEIIVDEMFENVHTAHMLCKVPRYDSVKGDCFR